MTPAVRRKTPLLKALFPISFKIILVRPGRPFLRLDTFPLDFNPGHPPSQTGVRKEESINKNNAMEEFSNLILFSAGGPSLSLGGCSFSPPPSKAFRFPIAEKLTTVTE